MASRFLDRMIRRLSPLKQYNVEVIVRDSITGKNLSHQMVDTTARTKLEAGEKAIRAVKGNLEVIAKSAIRNRR